MSLPILFKRAVSLAPVSGWRSRPTSAGWRDSFMRLATGEAALAVRQLRIVAPDPGSPDRVPEILKIEATVEGWYVRDRAAGKADR